MSESPPPIAIIEWHLATLTRENRLLTDNLTSVQRRCTELLEETREVRALLKHLRIAREKHPEGANISALIEEVGEVGRAIRRNEGTARIREELLDVAVVALRIWLGELSEPECFKNRMGEAT